MTATTTTTTTVPTRAEASSSTPSLWRPGMKAGLVAAAATTAIAAAAQAVDVTSLETAPGEAIPILGFAQLTLVFTAVGVLIARSIRGRAQRPQALFTRVTVGLTALSFVPDLLLDADVATKATLVLTHVVAAAIVIPALAGRLPERQPR